METKLIKFVKNHYVFIGLTLVFAFIFSVSTSYAKYVVKTVQSSAHTGDVSCFKLSLEEGKSIGLDESIPLTDEYAKNLTPYTFTIKNICNNSAAYDVNIEDLNKSTIDLKYIKYSINNLNPTILDNAKENDTVVLDNSRSSHTIAKGTLDANKTITFQLRLWIDENAIQEDIENKTFVSKVVVTATLNKNYVTFDLKGGVMEETTAPLVNNKLESLPTPTKEGYFFRGWFTKDGAGEQVSKSTTLNPGSVIYARWEKDEYTITYELDGGTLSSPNPTVYNSTSNFTIVNPTKSGYTFTGWTEKINNFTWYKGFVNMGSGKLYEDSSYPESEYTELVSVRSGETVRMSETNGYKGGDTRIRAFNTDGSYLTYGGNDYYTASKDCMVRVMYLYTPTSTQRQSAALKISDLKTTASITPGTRGNRKFIANYEKNS